MRENLLYIPFRKTEQIKISQGLRQCIENDYNQHPDKFAKDLVEIDRLRDQIVDITVTTESLNALFQYAAQLMILSAKFPSDIQTDLTWYNTLGYASNAAVKYPTVLFDQINVVYNIGALYSQLGFQQPKDSADGQKKAYNYFQLAAGTFQFLIDDIIPLSETPLPMGLDESTLQTLKDLLLAQAQECFWQKAVADGMRNSIVSKMAAQVYDFYSRALSNSNKSNSIRSEWVHHIGCKKYHFDAAAHYRAALDCLDRSKYGEEVARLKACVAACRNGLMNSKYVSGVVIDDIQGLNNKASSDLQRAEKDNDLIYLQPVPDVGNIPAIPRGTVMSSAQKPKELINSFDYLTGTKSTVGSQGSPLFAGVLPYAVYQAARVYSEQLDSYIYNNVATVINKLVVKLHDTLAQLQLPGSLDAVEKPLGIPQALLAHSDEIRSRGGVQQLQESASDVAKLSSEARNLLTEAKDTMEVEGREDSMMRSRQGTDRWNRAPSKEAASDLWNRYETNKEYLETAGQSDDLVLSKFSSVLHLLTVLENGKPAIQQFVPNTTVVQLDRELQKVISELREALGRAQSLEVYWNQKMNHLKSSVHNHDLFPSMEQFFRQLEKQDPYRKFDAAMFEPVYQRELKKYDKEIEWVQGQDIEMNNILNEIKNCNNAFLQSGGTDTGTQQRQQAIQSLEVAHAKFQEIQNNLEEGRKFYNSILDQLKVFLNECKTFAYERRVEARNLEIDIRSSMSGISGGSSSNIQQQQQQIQDELETVTPVAPTPLPAARKMKPWSTFD